VVLNAITRLRWLQLGKAYENLMVDLQVTTTNYGTVARESSPRSPASTASGRSACYRSADGHVKLAVVMHRRNVPADQAAASWNDPVGDCGEAIGMNADSLTDLIAAAVRFRDERDWAQFHNPKDWPSPWRWSRPELLQLCNGGRATSCPRDRRKARPLKDSSPRAPRTALAAELKIEPGPRIPAKAGEDRRKVPVEKAKGSARKYTEALVKHRGPR